MSGLRKKKGKTKKKAKTRLDYLGIAAENLISRLEDYLKALEKNDDDNSSIFNRSTKKQGKFFRFTRAPLTVRCMFCPDAGEKGRENYALTVANGICPWCGWKEK